MFRWWHDLSVSKKLYAVVGLMAILIATELFTLLFAMNIMSSVRAFVQGEGLWSKAQKDAIHSLYQYALHGEEKYFQDFQNHLQIPLGDRKARLELAKVDFDYNVVYEGFIQGGNHPNDIDGMIKLLRRFHRISYISDAVKAWTDADLRLEKLQEISMDLQKTLMLPKYDGDRIRKHLDQVAAINIEMTKLEGEFSASLGAGSRWLESILMTILVLVVLTIEGTGVMLTILFSRNLNRSLKEMMETAGEVGRGNFSMRAPVHSKDELGQLAASLNKMTDELKKNIGERQQAESASHVKSIFLANMSHEIRTPLGVILGFTEVLKDPELSDQQRAQYLDTIESMGQNLGRIINDILDISKVESGHLETESLHFSVQDLFDELQLQFRMQAEHKRNQMFFRVEPESMAEVHTDRLRLQQILTNLINNALRFTENGMVEVQYKNQGSDLLFRVIDTGIGLSQPQISKLFALFSQADQSTTRKYGGTGLGLVLSKRLAQILGGDVTLESSEVNKGSTFLVKIMNQSENKKSVASIKSAVPQIFDVEKLKGKKVLVVDDSMENQMLLQMLLSKVGIIVETATNGAIGVEKALKGNFDLIFMDIQMPVLDGYVATEKLRANGYDKPIVALTANAMKEDRDRSLQAGCNDYLTKPIDSKKLVQTIARNIA